MEFIKDIVLRGSTKGSRWQIMQPTSITIHNTGNSGVGADALSHADYIKRANTPVSWHYTVDDKRAVQHFEHNIICWHAGTNQGNITSIGVEICMNADGNFEQAYANAIELVKKIMAETGIKTIKKHQDWSGKYCPQVILNKGLWNDFINKCNEKKEVIIMDKVSEWARSSVEKAISLGYIKGDGQGNYGATEPLTLERFLRIMDNMNLLK